MLENSEHDNQSLMVSEQISDVEWTAGPNMNWVMSQSISVVYYSACVLHAVISVRSALLFCRTAIFFYTSEELL